MIDRCNAWVWQHCHGLGATIRSISGKIGLLNAEWLADAIITSGGVAVGEADYTKTMMRQKLGDG